MNHVITFCHSLTPDLMPGTWVMLRSLRHHSPETHIHVLVGPAMTRDQFPVDVEFEQIPMPSLDAQSWIAQVATLDGPEHGISDSDRVLIADMRDVVFQGNPFASVIAMDERVDVFSEDRHHDCDTCDGLNNNGAWMRKLHGGKVPDKVRGKPIICFGTVAGIWGNLQAHFKEVDRWMNRTPVFYGRDQVMRTSMVHSVPELFRVHANEDGPVLTCALLQCLEVRGNPIRLYNERSQLPPVVHQYDRLPELAEKIIKEWVP